MSDNNKYEGFDEINEKNNKGKFNGDIILNFDRFFLFFLKIIYINRDEVRKIHNKYQSEDILDLLGITLYEKLMIFYKFGEHFDFVITLLLSRIYSNATTNKKEFLKKMLKEQDNSKELNEYQILYFFNLWIKINNEIIKSSKEIMNKKMEDDFNTTNIEEIVKILIEENEKSNKYLIIFSQINSNILNKKLEEIKKEIESNARKLAEEYVNKNKNANNKNVKFDNSLNIDIDKWEKIPGELKQLSISDLGLYGVNEKDEIWYREGINCQNKRGNSWCKIDGLLKHISVGKYGIWGVNMHDEIWYRNNVTKGNPLGNGWTKVDGLLKMISVSEYGVFGVNMHDEIWFREGVSSANRTGIRWVKIDGLLKYISAGKYGVWGVSKHDEIWYRNNATEKNPKGNGWTKVDGLLKMISVSDYGVWGVNSSNGIYYRKGINEFNKIGTRWVKIEGRLKNISVG